MLIFDVVGPGGTNAANQVSTSNVGPGGLAIAGGSVTATAGRSKFST